MKSLLYLCHRIPFPPDKGDKIRSFHVLEELRTRYQVHLGTFVDAEEDWQHLDALRARTASLCVLPLPRALATLRSLRAFATADPLTLLYYRDARLLQWVRQLAQRESLAGALVYSSAMAQYLDGLSLPVRVMDFCDLDSDKWAQYARSRRWPWSWVYGREARLLANAESRIASEFDASLFVSEVESEQFCSRNPQLATRVATVGNGVDTGYFDPDAVAKTAGPGVHLVFTGAMDYWANVDAVRWFAQEVWGQVRAAHPEARFSIVGSKPGSEVQELGKFPGITVTGRVPDVRPWLSEASVVVAPLRIARGVQNKVLEAMSMARPVVATGAALQGLGYPQLPGVIRADAPHEFAAAIEALVTRGNDPVAANRQFVMDRFGWAAALRPLWPLLERAA